MKTGIAFGWLERPLVYMVDEKGYDFDAFEWP
jgi:hypothetical protein